MTGDGDLRERAERWIDAKLVERNQRIEWDRQVVTLKVFVGYGEPTFYLWGMPIDRDRKLTAEESWGLQVRDGRPLTLSAEGRTEKEARERMVGMLIEWMGREEMVRR